MPRQKTCSFCKRAKNKTDILIQSTAIKSKPLICNYCVQAAIEIIHYELIKTKNETK